MGGRRCKISSRSAGRGQGFDARAIFTSDRPISMVEPEDGRGGKSGKDRVMALKVVGAGFGRTGTNSLKLVLEQLGFGPCHHMLEVRGNPAQQPYWHAAARGETMDWDAVFADYNASVDWPSARFWRELAAYYPSAKVLLSVRPEEDWFRSIDATILDRMRQYRTLPPGEERDRRWMAHEIIVRQTFGGEIDDKAHILDVYRKHNAEVRRSLPADRLLTYDAAEGWDPLCAFLGVPVPVEPFPHTNTTAEFQARASGRT